MKKGELPPEEFRDFSQTYDETMWQHPDEEKEVQSKKNPLDNTITDEIKEEEQEGSDDSDGEDGKKPPSPGAESTGAGSNWNRNVDEGDEGEDTFPSLDEALNMDFDINKVSRLDQRLKDVNR